MYNIRPISDLRTKLHEIEKTIGAGEPVFLTKNGRGTMVVISIEEYYDLVNDIERKLDDADRVAADTNERYSLEEVHERVLAKLNEQETVQNTDAADI